MKEDGFMQAKASCRRYLAWTITDTVYADEIALLGNTPAQVQSLLHNLLRAAGGIGVYVNVDKTEFICFYQRGDIYTLNGRSLKLEDKFTHLESSVSSTENDINTQLSKAWTAIDRLSVTRKSDKIK